MKQYLLAIFLMMMTVSEALSPQYEHNGLPSCRKTDYTYSTLALTWLGQYCSEYRCARNWRDVWDGKSFAIHGYWPASKDLAFLSCQNDNKHNGGYDQNCYTAYDFDLSKISSIRSDLEDVWPQIGSIRNFWEHQWNKHGTCYLKLTLEKNNPKRLSSDEIFRKFFQGAIEKYRYLYLDNITKSKYATKDELAIDLGLYQDEFAAVCGKDNELDEVRICYNLAAPGSEEIIKCPSKPKECKFPTYMKGE